MSFSFNVRGQSRDHVLMLARDEMDRVVQQQPCHRLDYPVVMNTVRSVVAQLHDDDTRDLVASVSGYLAGTWNPDGSLTGISGASVAVTAGYVERKI